MNDVSEDEAQRLLGSASYCDGCTSWADGNEQGEKIIVAGLTDTNGNSNGLELKLRFLRGAPGKGKSYVFSIFSTVWNRTDRVYQLAIKQSRRPPKQLHQLSHEHFGHSRMLGTLEWEKWSYAQVLEYFCTRTNVIFRPSPPDPQQSPRRKK